MKQRKKLILLLVICLLQVVVYAAKVNTLTIYFAKDKYIVTGAEGEKLYALKNADLIMLHGHTDADGSNVYNEQLSAKRVAEVQRIVAQLCPNARVETKHYGEYEPINANEDEVAKTANRRVEVSYIVDPLLSTKVPVQSFTIDTRIGQTITCKQGTQVVIPAGAFAAANVTINVTEYYDPLQIFSANLSTKCNGAPIETAGMIYITAEVDGKHVEPMKDLQYKFPRSNMKKDFKFFEGKRDESYNMNWVLPEKKVEDVKPKAIEEKVKNPVDDIESIIDWLSLNNMKVTMTNAVNGRMDSAMEYLNNGRNLECFKLYEGCIKKGSATVVINSDGRIARVSTSYTDKNSSCDREIRLYLEKSLPKRFAAARGESVLTIDFRADSMFQQVRAVDVPMVWNSEVPAWSMDHLTADYETDKIVLKASKLGWINCDRFMAGQQLATYTVKADTNANVRLVLNKYNAYFINEYWGNDKENKQEKNIGQFSFLRVPVNEPATIISTKRENGKLYLAMQAATTKQGLETAKLVYKEVSKAELEAAIRDMKL